jgi:hypothetical protein
MHTVSGGEELDQHICNSRSVYAMVDGKIMDLGPDSGRIWVSTVGGVKVVGQSPAWENVPDFGSSVGFALSGGEPDFVGINFPEKDNEAMGKLYKDSGHAPNWIQKYPRAGPQSEVCTLVYEECPNIREVLGASLGYAGSYEFALTIFLIPTLMLCGCINTKNSFFKDFVVSIVAEGVDADLAKGLTNANELGEEHKIPTQNPMHSDGL